MMPKAAIVVTTIFEPAFLPGYVANLRRFETQESTTIYVIIDRKTPASVAAACEASVRDGFRVVCPSLDEQSAFLTRVRAPAEWIPFNTDNRRNIGYLMAFADGCDFLISIDDDNFCPVDTDFVGSHAVVGQASLCDVRDSSSAWINICGELSFESGEQCWPRGFPYAARRKQGEISRTNKQVIPAINAGLWTDDPDVDAIARLASRPRASAYSGKPFCLGATTWSPVNTQNTCLSREALIAYYYVRMGFPIQGMTIDRYGDILSGYFAQKCVRHLGHSVRIGDPICEHHRTQHNLFKDLYHELAGMVIIEELLPWLVELRLTGSNYRDAYACLADELAANADRFTGFVFDRGGNEFLRDTAANMKTWLSVTKELGST